VKLGIPEGSFNNQALSAAFVVGPGCEMQALKLQTALIAESWRYRYAGVIMMHGIRIERLAS
jgi:hypothetical protein